MKSFGDSKRRFAFGMAKTVAFGALACLTIEPARAQDDVKGKWGPVMDRWPNVPIHVHLLPNGKVMFWGRRDWKADGSGPQGPSLDPHDLTPHLWDPAANAFTTLPRPGFNPFCAGHAFLPDGRLFVAGGHWADGRGVDNAAIFDPATNTWQQLPAMNRGRWYPTVVTLADGAVLVSGGTDRDAQVNNLQQIFRNGAWHSTVTFNDQLYYPRLLVAPDARVLLAGPDRFTQRLDTGGAGNWTVLGNRVHQAFSLKEAPAVMFEPGKVIHIGGGDPPQNAVERIDLNQANPQWENVAPMARARRHHNATLLPDGSVLVTGGAAGGGFNNRGTAVKLAELWNPVTAQWSAMAEETVQRLYHATAVLLPDGRVLSAGGGEYNPDDGPLNVAADSRNDAQIFSPPYLFKSTAQNPRPVIAEAPGEVEYGATFPVRVEAGAVIARVTWVRLGSVTHAWNSNQRFNALEFTANGQVLSVKAPPTAALAPPGHYMLFVLDQAGVPSVARITRIK